MRYGLLIIMLGTIPAIAALTPQELGVYRNRMADRLLKDIPAVMPNLEQRVARQDIPTNKEVHYAYADAVIGNLLDPSELQLMLDIPTYKNIPERTQIFGNQPASVKLFLETIVNWLATLNRLRFLGKQYQSNYANELVFFAPYAQAVITDPDNWQIFIDQLKKYTTVISSPQFLKEHQDLKPQDIQFALTLITPASTSTNDLSAFTIRLQQLQEKLAQLQQQLPRA